MRTKDLKLLMLLFLVMEKNELLAQVADSISTHRIPEVIITATRTAKPIDRVGREVTVITSEEIREAAPHDLAQLLSQYAGISVIGSNQNPGMTESIFMRGANSNQTVIMMDGIAINDPSSTNHAIDLSELPLSNIDRIEIVRGSHSTLYGSSAIGGVINIITKKNMMAGLHGDVSIAASTFGPKTLQLQENIFLNYTFQNEFYTNLDLFNLNVNGLDATVDTSLTSATFKNFDDDDFDQQRISGKAGFKNYRWDVFAAYSFTNMAADYDKSAFKTHSFDVPGALYDGDSTRIFTKRHLANYQVAYQLLPQFNLKASGGYTTLHRSTIDDSSVIDIAGNTDHSFADGRYEGSFMNIEMQGHYQWKQIELMAGAGLDYETMTTATHYFNSAFQFEIVNDLDSLKLNSTLTNFFTQLDVDGNFFSPSLKNFNLLLGARYNHHDLFGDAIVYEINPSFNFEGIARIYASYSTGFNAPSLYQLYAPEIYYTSLITRGNPKLQPEYSKSTEVGIKFFPDKKIRFGLSFYETIVQHSIEYVYLWDKNIPIAQLGGDFNRDDYRGDTYLNVGSQLISGGELYFNLQLLKWLLLDGNINIVRGKLKYSPSQIDTSHTEGNHVQLYSNGAFPTADIETQGLVRRPETVNAAVTLLPIEHTTVRLSGKWVSSYNDIFYDNSLGPFGALNTIAINDYLLIDLLLKYGFNRFLSTTLKVENIFDAAYSEIRGFSTRGRGYSFSIAANF
jgi:vitamin B12 transporter